MRCILPVIAAILVSVLCTTWGSEWTESEYKLDLGRKIYLGTQYVNNSGDEIKVINNGIFGEVSVTINGEIKLEYDKSAKTLIHSSLVSIPNISIDVFCLGLDQIKNLGIDDSYQGSWVVIVKNNKLLGSFLVTENAKLTEKILPWYK